MSVDQGAYLQLYECVYTPTERQQHILNRLNKYYTAVHHMGARDALPHSRALHDWVRDCGYTREEFSQAKKAYWQMKGQN